MNRMTDTGCKREMTFEEELLAYNAKIKELLFAEDEYPGDSLLKSVLRDSQRILNKAAVENGTLRSHILTLQSEVSITTLNYKHTKELWEIEKAKVKRANERFIKAKKENNQLADIGKMYSEIKAEAVREFGKYLIDCATEGAILICNIPVCDIPDLVKKFLTEEKE